MGKKIRVSYFFMKNPYMKFQNPRMYGLEVMLCIKKRNGRTHGRTHARTNVPEAICPSNFFEVGGIIKKFLYLLTHKFFNISRNKTFIFGLIVSARNLFDGSLTLFLLNPIVPCFCTVKIQISWLLQKPTDLGLHCLPLSM